MSQSQPTVALVTGSSRGIGLEVVRALAAQGAVVVGTARTITPELHDAAHAAHPADLTTTDGPAGLVGRVLADHGRLDVLVNNAGGFEARTDGFAAVTDEDWGTTFETNLFSAVRTIRAALPSLIESQGAIVNVSSINARIPQPPVVDYAAAKAAMTNMGSSLAQELGPQGVRVNTVSPGPTRTPAWESEDGFGAALADASGASLDDFLEGLPEEAGLSTGRMTEPEEVARVVALLAGGGVRNVHGADIHVDGGQLTAA